MAFIAPQPRMLAWLTDSGEAVPADMRSALIRDYFNQSATIVAGAVCTSIVSVAAVFRTYEPVFVALLVAEIMLVGLRLTLMVRHLRDDAAGRDAATGLSFACGLLWALLIGVMVAVCVVTRDPFLMIIAPVTMMGIIAGIVTRNSVAPRFALAQIILLNLPFDVVLIGTGDPWFALIAAQFPLFLFAMKSTVWRLHKNYVTVLLAERDSESRATHDALTGLWNRAGLMRRLTPLLSAQRTGPSRLALLFVDLDGFKAVNDVHGHARGDQLLREVALRLRQVLPAAGLIARHGGDEFVLVVSEAGRGEVEALSRAAIEIVSAPVTLANGAVVHVGASIGIAWAEPGSHPDDLLADADAALYRAKAAGKGCFILAEPVALAA